MFKPPGWEWSQFGEMGWWVRTGSEWRDILLGAEGLRLDEWRAAGRVTTVKSGPHRIVYRVALPEGVIYIKHYLVPNRRAILRQWIRRGKGRNEGKRSQHLALVGVPTIWPIALGEQRKRKFLFENYLVTPEISDATPLDEFLTRHLPGWPEPRRARVRRELARALAMMTARLHDAGFLHEDFHPGNVLVRFPDGDHPELVGVLARLDGQGAQGLQRGCVGGPGGQVRAAERDLKEEEHYPDGKKDGVDDPGAEVAEGDALAVLLQHREHQDPVGGVPGGGQQHEHRADCQRQATRGNRGKVIRRGKNGLHEPIPGDVRNDPREEQHPHGSRGRSIVFGAGSARQSRLDLVLHGLTPWFVTLLMNVIEINAIDRVLRVNFGETCDQRQSSFPDSRSPLTV